MEHLIQPIPGPQCYRMQSRWHCSAGKKMSALSRAHVTFTHTIFHAQLCHTHTHMHTCIHAHMHTRIHAYMHQRIHAYMHTCIHAYMHTCIHAYIHTYIQTHTHTYIHTYVRTHVRLSFHILSHTQSFTTSFVFPSFPFPATTFETQYWKKLTCGVIQSFTWSVFARKMHSTSECAVIVLSESKSVCVCLCVCVLCLFRYVI